MNDLAHEVTVSMTNPQVGHPRSIIGLLAG